MPHIVVCVTIGLIRKLVNGGITISGVTVETDVSLTIEVVTPTVVEVLISPNRHSNWLFLYIWNVIIGRKNSLRG